MDSVNRRKLLKVGVLAGAAGAGATLILSKKNDNSVCMPSDVKGQFGHSANMLPMNAANLCPTLQVVLEKQAHYTRQLNEDVSLVHRRDFGNKFTEPAREKLARMLGVNTPENIAFVRNTSEANSTINNGFPLAAQDEVLGWEQNHPTNRHSWLHRQKRSSFKYSEVTLPENVQSQQQIVDAFVKRLNKHTKLVTFTELSNISGLRMPSKLLCEAIHNYNPEIFVHVDGAQSLGALNTNLESMGCDGFSSSGHKWFMGPRGTGILYVKEKWASRIWPCTLGYDLSMSYPLEQLPETAKRFECLGQRDDAPYAAMGDTVDIHTQLGGSSAIETQIQSLTQHALTALDNAGINTITPNAKGLGHGVVVADLGGAISAYGAFLALHNEGIAAAFVEGARVFCQPDQAPMNEGLPTYLRLSPHIYNSTEDIDRAVATIKRVNESKFEIVKEAVRFL